MRFVERWCLAVMSAPRSVGRRQPAGHSTCIGRRSSRMSSSRQAARLRQSNAGSPVLRCSASSRDIRPTPGWMAACSRATAIDCRALHRGRRGTSICHPDCQPRGALFIMVGAAPNTDWLSRHVELDGHEFCRTSAEVGASSNFATFCAGVFEVSNVRSASVKRVTSRVGERSMVVSAS